MNEEEIIEKYHHFKIKTADGIELDLIETKYYKELLDLYKQEKEENGKLRVELEQEKNKINTIKKIMSIGDITDEALFTLAQTIMAELGRLEDIEEQLVQEKEKNKELYEIKYIASTFIKRPMKQFSVGEFRYKVNNSISKDKIKELLENEIIDISGFRCIAVEDIEELLEMN